MLVAAGLSLLVFGPVAWSQQALVAPQSEIKFTFKQLGVPVSGHFKSFEADVQLDPADLAASSVKLDVDTGSATIGDAQTDAELVKQPWFDTAQFPKASFVSSSIKPLQDGQYEADGTLTIKGVSSAVKVPVTLEQTGDVTVASGRLPIQRLGYKIGDGDWSDTSVVADEVQVQFKFTLTGVGKL
ncbi:YceI family protein [Corticibacter populi]|uniref:YceI family protein n=2 Tax=Corticibacter populi TaxID=1550736 RepID=A0A3M6QPS8_9BURK|nr:YceI family protein [Corticibacter populi]